MIKRKKIPIEVNDIFKYNPTTGVIERLRKGGLFTPCGSLASDGYLVSTAFIDGARFDMKHHRLAWFLHYQEQPPDYLDHVNHIRVDNRICNIRAVTSNQNQHNCLTKKQGRELPKGVYFVPSKAKYRGQVRLNSKFYTKTFADWQDANDWVLKKRDELHGIYKSDE